MTYGYIRELHDFSASDQAKKLVDQCDEIIIEPTADHFDLLAMLRERLHPQDCILVADLTVLTRSLQHLITYIDVLQTYGIQVRSLNAAQNMALPIFQEINYRLIKSPVDPVSRISKKTRKIGDAWITGNYSISELATQLHVKESTIDHHIRRYRTYMAQKG